MPKTPMDRVTHNLATEQADPRTLTPYPGNPRRGNLTAIKASLLASGQYRPVIVSRTTGYILAGNHLNQAAIALDWPHVAVTYLDNLSPEAEARIVAVDNRTADLGTYDDAQLVALLESLSSLDGTGFEVDDLETLQFIARGAAEVINPATDAHFNGVDSGELEDRAERVGNYQSMKAQGLEEIIVVLPASKKEQAVEWMQTLRARWGIDMTNGEIIHAALGRAVESA